MKRILQLTMLVLLFPALARATISPQQGCNTNAVVATTTNCVMTVGASLKGDTFVFFGVCAEAVSGTPCPITPSDNQSNSYAATPDGINCVTSDNLCTEVYTTRTQSTTTPTVTITSTAAASAVMLGVEEYSNMQPSPLVDQSGHTNGSSTTASFGNQTTIYNKELVMLFVLNSTGGLSGAMGTCASRQANSAKTLIFGDVYETAKGTFDCTATLSPTGVWLAHQITFIEQVAKPPAIY